MSDLYLIGNYPRPTTAAVAAVATGTSIKTMLQVKLGASQARRGRIVEWGICFDGSALATPIKCELISTKTVAATVTAHVASGIMNLDPKADAPTTDNPFTLSTSTTGYTASAEGTITDSRFLDGPQFILPTNQYVKQIPLGDEGMFADTEYVRIRVHAGADVDCLCYMKIRV